MMLYAEQQGLSSCPATTPGLPSPTRAQLPSLPARPDAAAGPTAPLPRAHATRFLHAGGAQAKEGEKVVAPEKFSSQGTPANPHR